MKQPLRVTVTVLLWFTTNGSAQSQGQVDQVAQFQSIVSKVCSDASILAHDIVDAKERGQSQAQTRQIIDNSGVPIVQKIRLTGLLNIIFGRPNIPIEPMTLATSFYMSCVISK